MTDVSNDNQIAVIDAEPEEVSPDPGDFTNGKNVYDICVEQDPKNGQYKYKRLLHSKILYGILNDDELVYIWCCHDRASINGEFENFKENHKDKDGLKLIIIDPRFDAFNVKQKYNLIMLLMLLHSGKIYTGPRFA